MLNSNSFNNIHLTGKNILKDSTNTNTTDIFSNTSQDYLNNSLLNTNLEDKKVIE